MYCEYHGAEQRPAAAEEAGAPATAMATATTVRSQPIDTFADADESRPRS